MEKTKRRMTKLIFPKPAIHAAAETIGMKGARQREQKGCSKQRSIGITNAEASQEYNIV